MHKNAKYENKPLSLEDDFRKCVNIPLLIQLEDIDFRKDGMFLIINTNYAVRISLLVYESDDYIAYIFFDYFCANCGKLYQSLPSVCDCGSSDIRESE